MQKDSEPEILITLWRLFEKYALPGSDKMRIRMDMYNNGAKYLTMLKWRTPLDLHEESPLSEFLDVQYSHCSTEKPRGVMWCTIDSSKANETLRYLGPRFKRANPVSSSYKKMRPSERVTENIDITDMYDFSRVGLYGVTVKTQIMDMIRHWNQDYKITDRVSANFTKLEPLESNVMRFEVYSDDKERIDPTKPYEEPNKRAPYRFESKPKIHSDDRQFPQRWQLQGLTMHPRCTAEQKKHIQSTMKHVVLTLEKSSTLTHQDISQELREWYGSDDETTFTRVQRDLKQISNFLTSSNVTSQLDLQCGVEKQEDQAMCGPETYSFATARNNRINLCEKFFTTTEETTKQKRDSAEGIMVHELAHLVLDQRDWAVSEKQCRKLSKELQLQNANTLQFFFEDLARKVHSIKGDRDEL